MGTVKGGLTSLASANANKTSTSDSSSKDSDTTNRFGKAFIVAVNALKNKKNATTGGVEGSPYVGDDPSKKQAGRRRGTNTQASGRGLNVT